MSDSDNAALWLRYAHENLQMAQLARKAGLLNPCLHNVQQAVEKSLKAIMICQSQEPRRTHSIRDLAEDVKKTGIETGLNDSDCELLDSIFVSSKYPPDSALPCSMPNETICLRYLSVAEGIIQLVGRQVEINRL